MKNPDLSIIVVSYNTADITVAAVESVLTTVKDHSYEVIVVDNASHDDSVKKLQSIKSEKVQVIANNDNVGFAKGNNIGVKKSSGRYVLFLNSDTVVHEKTLDYMIKYMGQHEKVGAASCKLNTPDGGIDYASHRGFPTPWNSFAYFSGLSKVFPKIPLFSGYTQSWKDMSKTHEVDAITGAFMFVRREAGEQVKWWDEDYFFNGEDLDFCYKLREKGWKIMYIPEYSILHYNGMSGGTKKGNTTATRETKSRVQDARFDAMKLFYTKHYQNKYPKFIQGMVFAGIDLKKLITKKRQGL
ncbi:MAG TPA: glycosyltransferase family 2 protein [Candidatus Levybacteria bacterium]|nr:glycosyltransferase family 2 protein [Candidatus Levybacteria bacterium]